MNSGSLGFCFIEVEIGCSINERFVDAVHMNIHRRSIPEDDGVDQGADPLIFRHAWNSCDVMHLCPVLPLIFLDRLLCFKQAGPGRDTDGFEGRRDCQADRLIRAAFVCDQEVRGQRIVPSGDAFHGGIERFHVNRYITMLGFHERLPPALKEKL